MDLHKIIQDALYEFVQSYISNADLSALDDVILSYITGVLEDLGSEDSLEENFDVELFVEMLDAYIPGFAEIDCVKVCEMMFNLSSKLAIARNTGSDQPKTESFLNDGAASTSSSVQQQDSTAPPEGAAAQEGGVGDGTGQVQYLVEMFPKCTVAEARSAWCIAKGDMDEAVRLIIEGDVPLSHALPLNVNLGEIVSPRADQKLKESILEKYMLVDSEEDKKVHRPLTPKEAPKKLVRYHGNQVVTTKGERYHQVKKEESEDMKKTYVSLKPARKYRFH